MTAKLRNALVAEKAIHGGFFGYPAAPGSEDRILALKSAQFCLSWEQYREAYLAWQQLCSPVRKKPGRRKLDKRRIRNGYAFRRKAA